MKKNSFVEGALISTIGIVLCKVIGLIYVIPFRAIIGTEGAILYGYAYTIYAVFVGLSSNGIPGAMAKVISEYNTLGYNYTKEQAYKIGKMIIVGIGIVSFLILFIFAPQLAHFIIGDIEGGNSIESIVLVIRIISTAILFVPFLSVGKGYLQGHKIMGVSAIANVLEQVVRVVFIIGGSFLAVKVFHLKLDTSVGIAVFGATVGALIAYLYVLNKINKNRELLNKDAKRTREEAKFTNKIIAKRIVLYALPFVLIETIRSIYNTVDTFTVVRTLVKLGYEVNNAESILSLITTWGAKLNMIVLAIAMGLTMSIIPNIVSSFVKNDLKDVSNKVNQSLKIILYTALPLTIGICFLSRPVWTMFYGYDLLSIDVFKIYILGALSMSFYFVLVDTTQALGNTKVALGVLLTSFLFKIIMNIPMMNLFNSIGIEAYYAPIFVTFFVQFISIIFLLSSLHKKYKVSYKENIKSFIKIIVLNLIMLLCLLIARLIIGTFPSTRLYSVLEIMVYGIIGMVVYFFISYKEKIINDVFNDEFINKILRKFKK